MLFFSLGSLAWSSTVLQIHFWRPSDFQDPTRIWTCDRPSKGSLWVCMSWKFYIPSICPFCNEYTNRVNHAFGWNIIYRKSNCSALLSGLYLLLLLIIIIQVSNWIKLTTAQQENYHQRRSKQIIDMQWNWEIVKCVAVLTTDFWIGGRYDMDVNAWAWVSDETPMPLGAPYWAERYVSWLDFWSPWCISVRCQMATLLI